MRPEQLARPEGFRNFVDYLAELRTPTSPLLPSEWTADMIMNWLLRVADPWPVVLLWGAALAAVALGALVHRRLFHSGFSKAQEGAERKVRRPLRGPLGAAAPERARRQARVHLQGPAALLPRQHPVEPAHPAGRAAPDLHLQHQVAADPLGRADPVQPRHRDLVPEPGPRGIRAGRGRRPLHLSRRLAGGAPDVAAPLQPAGSRRRMLWSKYWTGTVPLLVLALVITDADQLAAAGRRLHDGGEPGHHPAVHPRGERAGALLRRLLPPVRHRERGPDPDQLRRGGLHDGEPEPARPGDHARGPAGGPPAPRLPPGRGARAHAPAADHGRRGGG